MIDDKNPNLTEVDLWAEIWCLRAELRGPSGFETWKDAAIHERKRRLDAERGIISLKEQIKSLYDKIS